MSEALVEELKGWCRLFFFSSFIFGILGKIAKEDADACQQIGDLCREEENRVLLASLTPLLVELLKKKELALPLKQLVPRALANLCFENADNRLVCSGAAKELVELMGDQDEVVNRNAVGCVSNVLSVVDDAGKAMVEGGALEALVKEVERQEALACRGLSNAASSEEWSVRLGKAGALEALVREREKKRRH